MDDKFEFDSKIGKDKETRWDRIRKRHTNSLSVRTETVKKFIDMDFIGKKNLKIMNGDLDPIDKINPVIVMDLRHEMIERVKKKAYKTPADKQFALERLKAHNYSVDKHYIKNELNKFKNELEKIRIKSNKCLNRPKLCLNLTNNHIFKSLKNCTESIDDFYAAPIEAIEETNRISDQTIENLKKQIPSYEVDSNQLKEPINLVESTTFEIDEIETIPHEKLSNENDADDRCVRFEDSVQLINYHRQDSFCSTSDGVDSVISEMAEEVLEEIENEARIEMIGRNFDTLQITAVKSNDLTQNMDIIHEEIYDKNDLNKEICFTVNDDLLKIKRIQPDSNEIQLTVEVLANDSDGTTTSNVSESISNEQNAIIAELFKPKYPKNEDLLKRYLVQWIHFTTFEKIEKENFTKKNDRFHQINSFLNNIRIQKNKITKANNDGEFKFLSGTQSTENRNKSVIITKKYQNKIKVQQDIIDLQKLKLEKQERMIMELKLNKIDVQTKLSKQDIKNELKAVIRTGAVKNRVTAKSLQLVGNLRDDEDDEFAKLRGKAYLMPKFLEKMQERALERNVKHEQAKQRRLQKDAEKEAAKIAAEEEKRAEDEETKRLRIEALQEKRRLEKQAKLQKERDKKRYIENIKKSEDFCRRRFLRRFGMIGFINILERKRKNIKISEAFRKKLIKRNFFKLWVSIYLTIWEKKNQMAIDLYMKIIKRMTLKAWICYAADERSKYYVAIDWHSLKLTENIYNNWLQYSKNEKQIEEIKLKKADSHFKWHLKWRVLDRWQRLQQILKLEHETETRREKWRLKIWELLPDYKPNIND